MDALTALIKEDAVQSMPPMTTARPDDIFTWWFGPESGVAARG